MKLALLSIAVILSMATAATVFADEPFQSVQREAVKILRTKYPDWVEILTPPVDAPEEVKNNLVKLFNDFEQYRK